jgi:hypothetical protein
MRLLKRVRSEPNGVPSPDDFVDLAPAGAGVLVVEVMHLLGVLVAQVSIAVSSL